MSGEAAHADAIRREREAIDAALAFMDETAESFGLKIYDPQDEDPDWLRKVKAEVWSEAYQDSWSDRAELGDDVTRNPYRAGGAS